MSLSEFEKKQADAEEILTVVKKYNEVELCMYGDEGEIEIDGVTFHFDEDKKITQADVGL